ncbi:MAG: hypothetical protein KGH76_01780 [Thaumarchaeota archaeon]|nr:hypothetical protein [Nitrososphaerota archaeon]
MSDDFASFCKSVSDLAKSFEKKNVLLKMHSEPDSGILRIYGEGSSSMTLAKTGLEEIEELTFTTAEHHPYWNLLYNSSQILKIVLEKWDGSVTEDEIKEITWHADEIKNSANNISHNHCE